MNKVELGDKVYELEDGDAAFVEAIKLLTRAITRLYSGR